MDCTICPVCLFVSLLIQWSAVTLFECQAKLYCSFQLMPVLKQRNAMLCASASNHLFCRNVFDKKKKIHPYKWTFQYDFNQWDQSNLVPHKNETHKIRLLCNSCLVTGGWLKWLVLLLLLFFQGYKMHAFYYKWHLTGWKYVAVIFLNFNSKGAYFAVLTQRPIVSTVVCNAAFLKYSKY